MKLLKIGSSANCNVVLNSQFVSSLHAEMLLTDDGRIYLEDKNSLNGTYVGSRKLTPNEKTQVQRGDLIKFGDAELNWTKVPVYKGPKAGEEWFNIGSGEKCEIIVSGPFIGRYNSILMIKDKKAYIMDNESRNGTMVDGKKIAPNKFVPIKKGTSVICGDTDITEQLQEYIPGRFGWLKPLLLTIGTAAVLTGVFFLAKGIIKPKVDIDAYANSVMYVDACYHYVAELEGAPLEKDAFKSIQQKLDEKKQYYSGTAFLIDDKGTLATCNHIAEPWEYVEEEKKNEMINYIHDLISEGLGGIKRVEDYNYYNDEIIDQQISKLYDSPLGKELVEAWSNANWNALFDQHLSSSVKSEVTRLNNMLDRLTNAQIKLVGQLDFIQVGFRGRNYSSSSEFQYCSVLIKSDDKDKDIALLKINDLDKVKGLGKGISIENVYLGKIEPLKELIWIGYPRGLRHGLLDNIQSLEPVIRNASVGQKPDRYNFEFEGESLGGASGAPIINKKTGELYGVLWGKWDEATAYGKACQAKYLKELYEKQFGIIR